MIRPSCSFWRVKPSLSRRRVYLFVASLSLFLMCIISLVGLFRLNSTHAVTTSSISTSTTNTAPKKISHPEGQEPVYVPGTDKVYVMIRTGASRLWEYIPQQLATTGRQVPHLAVYSDAPDEVDGLPIIDIFAHISKKILKSNEFDCYRKQQKYLKSLGSSRLYTTKNAIQGMDAIERYKIMPMVMHAYNEKPDADWYILMEDSSYVVWTSMMVWLNAINADDKLYLGKQAYINEEEFAHSGSVVIMSGALIRSTFGADPKFVSKYDDYTRQDCCGDHVLGHAFHDVDVTIKAGYDYPHIAFRLQNEEPVFVKYNSDNWCYEIASFHNVKPAEFQKFFDFERAYQKESIFYHQLYKHYAMPYITDRVEGWNNGASDQDYYKGDPREENADEIGWTSLDACDNRCDDWDDCKQFRWKEGHCDLGSSIQLGAADNSDNPWTSGWRVDRIRSMRSDRACDFLGEDELEEGSARKKSAQPQKSTS
ncbi:uncharacterized protein V1516DRAFT_676476 [Lipomyces oligophaga]|uniref:uncharacterized protein n=1 Tax=Lipomyces oligophaga TaxID=45792 RepID=UPI0034CDE066